MIAGFTAGAGAPGAGFADCAGTPAALSAALLSAVCFACSDFMTLRVLSMASGFCAQAPPAIIAITRMPVVSFIAIPTLPPEFRVLPRELRVQVANRD